MARRCTGEHLAMRPCNSGKKPLRRSMTMAPDLSEIYPRMEEVTRVKLGDKVITRRRLSKAESMAVETPHLEKTPSKTWKRLLRKQRTMGELDLPKKTSRMTFRSIVSRLDNNRGEKAKLTRNASVRNSYPDLSELHLSQPVHTSGKSKCNIDVRMDVDEESEIDMDTSERSVANDNDRTVKFSVRPASEYQRKIENIFLVDRHSSVHGMQLRSASIIQKSKFDISENSKLDKRTSLPTTTYSKILDFLYLGSIESAYNEPLLCKLKVHVLVDLSNVAASQVPAAKKSNCPCPCKKESHFRSRLNVGVDDIEWENISQHFNDINNFIEGARKNNKNVLVYSYHGKSRATTAVVQYIMQHFRLSLNDSFNLVQSRRPMVAINSGFWRALRRLEKELQQESGLPFRNPGTDSRLALGLPKARDAWPETSS